MKNLSQMKRMLIHLNKGLIIMTLLFVCMSCANEEQIQLKELTLQFDLKVNDAAMVFENQKYLTTSNQSIAFDRLKLYVSNVKLINHGVDETFVEVDSYHLLNYHGEQVEVSFVIDSIPSTFVFDQIEFSIGVDPLRNSHIDQVGDLDPAGGMAWDWNTGYKFLLLEGQFFPEGSPLGSSYLMHIGTDENYFTDTYPIANPIVMTSNQTLKFDVNAMAPFGVLDLTQNLVYMHGAGGNQVAQNYKGNLIRLNAQ